MVFDKSNTKHAQFAPVLEWVTAGKGRIIYGGTKYSQELRDSPQYVAILAELSRQSRTIQIPTARVDEIAKGIKEQVASERFNDEHLIALVIASRCCVVCTVDNGAIKYLRRPGLFSDHKMKRPRIFKGTKSNCKLCSDKYLAPICLPSRKNM